MLRTLAEIGDLRAALISAAAVERASPTERTFTVGEQRKVSAAAGVRG